MQQIEYIRYGKKPIGLVLIGFIFAARAILPGSMMFIYGLRFLDMQPRYLISSIFMALICGVFTFMYVKIVQGLFGFREPMRKLAVSLEMIILAGFGVKWRFSPEKMSLWEIVSIVITMVIIWYLSRDQTRAWFAPRK